jgi:hypothetical protein
MSYLPPSITNQFKHNPYMGYAPHNNLHATYNTMGADVRVAYMERR